LGLGKGGIYIRKKDKGRMLKYPEKCQGGEMKKAVKLLALFVIIALIVVPMVACAGAQGAKGDKGDTGAAGAQGAKGDKGDTGAAGANAQIVAVASNGYAIGYVLVGMGSMSICVLGSNFVPGAHVHLTICEHDTILKENIEVKECSGGTRGTFEADVVITQAMMGVVSIKAYVDDGDGVFDAGDVLWACCPLWVH
jgi:hypothetical protein